MNRANQNQLFQQTNIGLLSIRQSELNYYVSLNIAFGTQAALIGGFTYGVFTQNQVNADESYADIFQDIYWVTSAGTIAASVHVIITTMCIQVFGPGLALHGPIGSMARAAEGMRIEQKPVIVSFIIMMILFSLSTVLSFWAVMSFESAVAGTALYIIAGRYWYYYCERIYLRFYWKEEESKWKNSDDPDDNPAMVDPPIPTLNHNPLHEHHGERLISRQTNEGLDFTRDNDTEESNSERKKKSVLRGFRFSKLTGRKSSRDRRSVDGKNDAHEEIDKNGGFGGAAHANANDRNSVRSKFQTAMEGYMIKKGGYSGTDFTKEPWERRYVTLNNSAQLFIYKTRQAYRENAKHPIFFRPLNLHEFRIEVFNSEENDLTSSDHLIVDDNTGIVERRSSLGSSGSTP